MSASVTVDTNKIDRVLGELLALSVAEVGRTLVDIADDAEANAADKWYTQVRKRTGKTGKLKTELRRGTGDKLEAVVPEVPGPNDDPWFANEGHVEIQPPAEVE